jgi:thiol-disulfide isomerase/thioredoxin
MNPRRRLLLAATLWPLPVMAQEVGQRAPDIEWPDSGLGARLADLAGQVVYLDFWASWCTPCRLSFPWLNEMQRRHGSQGLRVVGINLDARRADADRFLARHPAQFALVFAGGVEAAQRLGIQGLPSSVLVGADGRVLHRHLGFKLDDRDELEALIRAALPAR